MLYADFNGSAPLHPVVREYLAKRIMDGPYANPNAIHSLGKKMAFGLEKCRRTCAKVLGCNTENIVFNSGASEGISQIFHSVLTQTDKNSKPYIVTSQIEHSAVVNACKYYQELGFKVKNIKTLSNGQIDLEELKEFINENEKQIAMITIMAANNETGVIQPWQEIAKLANDKEITFFSDTTQYIGKTEFNFLESGMDYAVLSGHKIGAIIGSGALLVKDPTQLKPLIFGGGQESGLRGGTQNYIGAETLAIALDEFNKTKANFEILTKCRQDFEAVIKENFKDVKIIGEDSPRLSTTTLISLPGIHGQAVQIELESNDIFVTTSSACSDNEPETSKVLRSMGVDDATGRGVVRISLCCGSTKDCYAHIQSHLTQIYNKLSKVMHS